MSNAMIVLRSLFKEVDPLQIEAQLAWQEWLEALADGRKNPSVINSRRIQQSVVKLHLAIGRLTAIENKRNLRDAKQSKVVDSGQGLPT